MKVYSKGDNGEILMHSDTYLGEDYTSPNLVHYKYIKKERKNGRWVYYYDDPTEHASDKLDAAGNKMVKAMNKTDAIYKNNPRTHEYYMSKSKEYRDGAKEWEKQRKMMNDRNSIKENLKRNLSYEAVKVLNKIEKVKLKSKKVIKYIDKGINKLKSLFGIK
jgi:hypothetical protein